MDFFSDPPPATEEPPATQPPATQPPAAQSTVDMDFFNDPPESDDDMSSVHSNDSNPTKRAKTADGASTPILSPTQMWGGAPNTEVPAEDVGMPDAGGCSPTQPFVGAEVTAADIREFVQTAVEPQAVAWVADCSTKDAAVFARKCVLDEDKDNLPFLVAWPIHWSPRDIGHEVDGAKSDIMEKLFVRFPDLKAIVEYAAKIRRAGLAAQAFVDALKRLPQDSPIQQHFAKQLDGEEEPETKRARTEPDATPPPPQDCPRRPIILARWLEFQGNV